MFLTEFDEKAWEEVIREESYEEGREEGREEGEARKLIEIVCRKLRKGKNISQIAEELEENEARIKEICYIAEEYAPGYDEKKVIEAVVKVFYGKFRDKTA